MPPFLIPPWEHPGADFSPDAHAVADIDIGGQVRRLMFKWRDGVIYFREAERASRWAIFRIFPAFDDAESLLDAARSELTAGNYGRYVAERRSLRYGIGPTCFAVICRRDGFGWIKEWFDCEWLTLQIPFNMSAVDQWNGNSHHVIEAKTMVLQVEERIIERRVEPALRRDLPPEWKRGWEGRMHRVVEASLQLTHPGGVQRRTQDAGLRLIYHAYGPNGSGNVGFSNFNFNHNPSAFRTLLKLIKTHFVFVGLVWQNIEEVERSAYGYTQSEVDEWSKRFGPDWRGNWQQITPIETFDLSHLSVPTMHDRMEAALELEAWLRGKLSAPEIETLLGEALAT